MKSLRLKTCASPSHTLPEPHVRPAVTAGNAPIRYRPCASTSSTTSCPRSGSLRRRGRGARAGSWCSNAGTARWSIGGRRVAGSPPRRRSARAQRRGRSPGPPLRAGFGGAPGRDLPPLAAGSRLPSLERAREAGPPSEVGRADRFDEGLSAEIVEVRDDGGRSVRFDRPLDAGLLGRIGQTPLPSYIRREPGAPDRGGPRRLPDRLRAGAARGRGAHRRPPLHGADPRRAARGRRGDCRPHAGGRRRNFQAGHGRRHRHPHASPEDVHIRRRHAPRSRGRRARGGVRGRGYDRGAILEAAARLVDAPLDGDLRFATDLFITPGFELRTIDALLTNFHLPARLSSCWFGLAGPERVLAAYAEAVARGYLFYSFGDAMLIA